MFTHAQPFHRNQCTHKFRKICIGFVIYFIKICANVNIEQLLLNVYN